MAAGAYIFIIVVSYILGATPSGFLVGKARGIDVRTAGSGNIGATNVMRVLGRGAGITVFVADGLKGFIAARWLPLLALVLFPSPTTPAEYLAVAGGAAAIVGHIYTFWLHFKGGKGVATTAGVVMAWAPAACLTALATWIFLVALTRFVSVGSIAAAIVLPFAVWGWGGGPTMTGVMTCVSILAIYKHKGNIQRLLKGEESRIGKGKK